MDDPVDNDDWVLTGPAFENLLLRFDSNLEVAATKYEQMRFRLRKVFESNRCKDPDELVNKSFDRAARKIEEGVDVLNIASYLMTIARYVLMEYWSSRERKVNVVIDDILPIMDHQQDDEPDDVDDRLDCLEQCAGNLPPAERERITRYYYGEKRIKIENRKQMAEEEAITLINLRVRMTRARARLEDCIRECMKKKGKQI